MPRKISKKNEAEKTKKGLKEATKRGKNAPWLPVTLGAWSLATLEIRVPRFSQKTHGWVSFRVPSHLAYVIFQKYDFRGTKSIDLCQHHRFAIKIICSSSNTLKSLTGRPRKHTFYPTNREINKIDGIGPLVAIND